LHTKVLVVLVCVNEISLARLLGYFPLLKLLLQKVNLSKQLLVLRRTLFFFFLLLLALAGLNFLLLSLVIFSQLNKILAQLR